MLLSNLYIHVPNIVGFVKTTTEKIPEFEINPRLIKFYMHRPMIYGNDHHANVKCSKVAVKSIS